MTAVPIGSVLGVEQLIAFGVSIFTQVFSLFRHPTNPVPTSAAPAISTALQATPGLTAEHKAVIATNVAQAVVAHNASPLAPVDPPAA